MEIKRCTWAKNPIDIEYHDHEWCVPTHNDGLLFEFLILEGMQAGLSWTTILNKRENMRLAFDGFNPQIIALYDTEKIEELMQNNGIIKNRRKINALMQNAKAFLEVQREFGSFDKYIWSFVNGIAIKNSWEEPSSVPISTELSNTISRDLKKRGFNFVGPTICYSFMQAIGMVNDHYIWCDFYN